MRAIHLNNSIATEFQKNLEPCDEGGIGYGYERVVYMDRIKWVDRPVEIVKYTNRPDTLGNKIGDYIAGLIDGSINTLKGLVKKLT